jgi:hypothetical protein
MLVTNAYKINENDSANKKAIILIIISYHLFPKSKNATTTHITIRNKIANGPGRLSPCESKLFILTYDFLNNLQCC